MWSYSKLVAQYGEDVALILLEFMDGFGEFEARTDTWEDRVDTPYDEVHDELPLFNRAPYRITDHRINVGVDITLWRKKESG